MNTRVLCISFCTVFALSACATLERGSRDNFIVYTAPIGASVTTDMAIEGEEDRYFGCAPTPCSMSLPRKTGFSVLISKDGYLPQSYTVESLRYKELVKRNQQAVIGLTVSSGAIIGASVATVDAVLMGIGGASTGVAATAIAMTVLPVAALGGLSLAIDADSGAGRDFYPNPLSIKFVAHVSPRDGAAAQQFIQNFDEKRRAQSPYQHYKRNKARP